MADFEEPLIDGLWERLKAEGSRVKNSLPQAKWRSLVDNFAVDFQHPDKDTGAAGPAAGHGGEQASIAQPLTYKEFLLLEGKNTKLHPYLNEVLEVPLQLPRGQGHFLVARAPLLRNQCNRNQPAVSWPPMAILEELYGA